MLFRNFLCIGAGVVAGTMACSSAGARAPANSQRDQPPETVVPRTVVTPHDARSIPELYADAERKLQAREYRAAARDLDRVFQLDPDGELAPKALFFAAVAHDHAAHFEEAVQRFEQVARRFPKDALRREALVRAIRIHAHLEHWPRAGELAEVVLGSHADLRPFEHVVVLAARGMTLIASGDLDRASYHVEKARTVVEEHGLDAAGELPRDLALLYFVLGELRRARAELIKFDPMPANFGVALEQRCQLLLDAQSAYSNSMRAYDAHWSAMAGYRVGELYQRLHEDLMRVPSPPAATSADRQQLFEGAMRLRYSILLRKAHAMMEHTLAMATRVGERSGWVTKAEDAKRHIERAIVAEDQALARLPYTRSQLEAALERLASVRAKPARTGPPTARPE